MNQATQPTLQSARIIALSLASGVFLFWGVGWVLTSGGQVGTAPDSLPAGLAFWIWAAIALPGFVMALVFRSRAQQSSGGASEVQKNLIIAWALLEGPALASGVFFLLLAAQPILLAAVPTYLLGVVLTFPRAAWFGEDDGVRREGP